MKLRITVDAELAGDALAALAMYAAHLAKHAKEHPESPFDWARHCREANNKTAAFRQAVKDAELAAFN